MANTGTLQNVAQRFPQLPPPSLPPLHHGSAYRPQSTDYLSMVTDDTNSNAT